MSNTDVSIIVNIVIVSFGVTFFVTAIAWLLLRNKRKGCSHNCNQLVLNVSQDGKKLIHECMSCVEVRETILHECSACHILCKPCYLPFLGSTVLCSTCANKVSKP